MCKSLYQGASDSHVCISLTHAHPHCNLCNDQPRVVVRGLCGKRKAILVRELETVEMGSVVDRGLEKMLGKNQGGIKAGEHHCH